MSKGMHPKTSNVHLLLGFNRGLYTSKGKRFTLMAKHNCTKYPLDQHKKVWLDLHNLPKGQLTEFVEKVFDLIWLTELSSVHMQPGP